MRFPLAAKIALVIAGTMGGTGGSAMPKGASHHFEVALVDCCAAPPRKVISLF